jgi:predicted GTPase
MNRTDKKSATLEAQTLEGPSSKAEKGIGPDLEKLREYSQAKLALAGQLRILRESLKTLGLDAGDQQCGELVVKLAEDRFILAVLGQFKRGKSSLMNAIIGRELLPTGVLPLTSAITTLKYGPVERLEVHRENSKFPAEYPLSSLSDYITEQGNPSNRKKVKAAYIELPVPFLRRGLEFVDTPGVGSAIAANTATTYDFLPQCDAVLFVTSVDTPMTSLELSFLRDIRAYVNKIFFVINKLDLVESGEREEVLEFVKNTIRSQIGHDDVKVFPVSARQGLAARISGNSSLYEESGIKALEEALGSFLSREKTTLFLTGIAQRVLRILDEENANGAFDEPALQNRAIAIQQDTTRLQRDPYAAVASLNEARQKIESLQKDLLMSRLSDIMEPEAGPLLEAESSSGVPKNVPPAMPATNMAMSFKVRGCPVCQRLGKYAFDFFTDWQYEISTNEQPQARFAAELGFCPLHTWQLHAVCSPYGASVGYAQLVERIAHILEKHNAMRDKGDAVRRIVRNSRNCRVCQLLRGVEEDTIRQIATMLEKPEERSRYRISQGVCLRHLGMLMDVVSTQENRDFILSHAAQRFEDDAEDMRSYAMKRDAIRSSLANNDEEDAYRRAIHRFVGGRNVCIPWAEDGEI